MDLQLERKSLETLISDVGRRIHPREEEYRKLSKISNELTSRARREAQARGLDVQPVLVGSFARDTWLSGEGDIDLFLLFPPSTSRVELERLGLDFARSVARGRGIVSYAEHPYVRLVEEGVRVDIVPAMRVEDATQRKTAVDRTPFHQAYVKSRLGPGLTEEVRLLKKFMKGIGAYGAEIKTLGFSGFVCELLTIKFGSFLEVLNAASNWKPPTLVTLGDEYSGELSSHLTVVDPTDHTRNAAAAVSLENYSKFIVASRDFCAAPTEYFFYPPKLAPPETFAYGQLGRHLVAAVFRSPPVIKETLWGELRRSASSITRNLADRGFTVLGSWIADDESNCYICLELGELHLSPWERKYGPQVYNEPDSRRFLEANTSRLERGPWVEEDRWVVEVRRKKTVAIEVLSETSGIGLSADIIKSYSAGEFLADGAAVARIMKSEAVAQSFLAFYYRRPTWRPPANFSGQ